MRKPKGWRAAENILTVRISETAPSFQKPKLLKGKFRKGIEYEVAAQNFLKQRYPKEVFSSVWFNFTEKRKASIRDRWCQVDCIHLDKINKVITIFEMKLKHTARAWWQLHTLYYPVVTQAFGNDFTYRVVEMTTFHDPDIQYPTQIFKTRSLNSIKNFPTTNVLIWRPNARA